MVAMLHAFVPKFQLGNEFIIQFSDIDIVQFILPLQERLGVFHHGIELGQRPFGELLSDKCLHLIVMVLEDFQQQMRPSAAGFLALNDVLTASAVTACRS